MKLFDLSGEVAVVIGATGVLGGALAEGLAEAGAKIAVLGRNAERGEARVKAIQAKGGKAAFFAADAISRCSLGEAHERIFTVTCEIAHLNMKISAQGSSKRIAEQAAANLVLNQIEVSHK
jgi:NAD(P)-dependent dehydrogenase (short-subunit alcohol dehydrogenase family)